MTILEIIGYVGYVVGAGFILASRTKNENLKDLQSRVEILENELKYSKAENQKTKDFASEQHIVNQKAISNLEGQLSTYKEIPLKSIADSLQALPAILTSNNKILDILNESAHIAKEEKAHPTPQYVGTQTVENQTVKSKA